MPDRNVQYVGTMLTEDARHAGHEIVEARDRDEVLFEHVGGALARGRFNLPRVVARFEVAPHDEMLAEPERVDHAGPQLLPEGQLGYPKLGGALRPVALSEGYQAMRDSDRLIRLRPGDGGDRVVPRRVEVSVVEDGAGGIADLSHEEIAVRRHGQSSDGPRNPGIVREPEGRIDDDAEATIAAYAAVEELGVFGPTRRDELSIGQDHPDGLDRVDERALTHVATVRVHAERPADGEVRIRLHDLDGQVVGIDGFLNLAPGDTRLHGDALALRLERDDVIERTHVEVQAVCDRDLPAHAVARAADRDRPGVRAYQLTHLVDCLRDSDPLDRDRVQLAHIVHDRRGRPPDDGRSEQDDRDGAAGEARAAHADFTNIRRVFFVGSPAWSRSPPARANPRIARYLVSASTERKCRIWA